MPWLSESLNRKFVAGTAAGLLLSSLAFLGLFAGLYRAELEQQKVETVSQVNRLLRTSLENAMLKRDLEGLRHIVGELGQQPGIASVMIVAPSGEVRFASRIELLGGKMVEMVGAREVSTRFEGHGDGEVLRSIHPVHNRAECVQCHGPVERRPVNGVLVVDYEAAPLRANARDTTLLLLGSGALVTLINLIGGWWFMRRFVLQPVGRLAAASRALAAGDLNSRVGGGGMDELGELGHTFDRMAGRLQQQMEQLREKEMFLQGLVDAIPDGVRVIGQDHRLLLANRAYRRQQGEGSESEVGVLCYRSSHRRDTPCPPTLVSCPLEAFRDSSQPAKSLHRHLRVDGSALEVEVYAAPMQVERDGVGQTLVVESIRDLASEIQYSQEQKMAEIGMLAAGVAHEIYNPLTSIRFALHAARESLESEPPDLTGGEEYLGIVDREVDQCIGITERLLRLSAAPPAEPELVSVNQAVAETASLLRWEAETSRVRLVVVAAEGEPRIWATDSELRMLTLNMMQNAFHAMPEGGELHLEVKWDEGLVEIHVRDTGVGIAPELHGRIFDPFYSRRANGSRGAGLGLAICKAIIDRYRGTIRLKSELGAGTSFTIGFPDAETRGQV